MPTPPKESIGGKSSYQNIAFDFVQKEYNYLLDLEAFRDSEEFTYLDEFEQAQILSEIDQRNRLYELLSARVDKY